MTHPSWRSFSAEECWRMLENPPQVLGAWQDMPAYKCWHRRDMRDYEHAEIDVDDASYRWKSCGESGAETSLKAAKDACDELLRRDGWALVNA